MAQLGYSDTGSLFLKTRAILIKKLVSFPDPQYARKEANRGSGDETIKKPAD